MNSSIQELLERIRALDEELIEHLQAQQEKVFYELKDREVKFAEEIKLKHHQLKQNVFSYLARSQLRNLISAPFIYGLFIPMLLLDISLFLYQLICFRLYGIKPVERSRYILIDRHHLRYLNTIEKINCVYCGYGNGLFAYAHEIASLTEQYWCPIKHASKVLGSHKRYPEFLDYGDGDSYREKVKEIRSRIIATDR